jgi:hypothetical protein
VADLAAFINLLNAVFAMNRAPGSPRHGFLLTRTGQWV